jgi:hypothetical protein
MAFRILSVFQTLREFDKVFEAYRDSTCSNFAATAKLLEWPLKTTYNNIYIIIIRAKDTRSSDNKSALHLSTN